MGEGGGRSIRILSSAEEINLRIPGDNYWGTTNNEGGGVGGEGGGATV